jgi:hypothetical protein
MPRSFFDLPYLAMNRGLQKGAFIKKPFTWLPLMAHALKESEHENRNF